MNDDKKNNFRFSLSRKDFLKSCGTLASAAAMLPFFRAAKVAEEALGDDELPKQKICKASELKEGRVYRFRYLSEEMGDFVLLKTGLRCENGVGEGRDIVAFSLLSKKGRLSQRGQVLEIKKAPSESFFYDLKNQGRVLSGKTSAALPQVRLQVEGAYLYAVGFYEEQSSSQVLAETA